MNYLCKPNFLTSQRQVFSAWRNFFEVPSSADTKQQLFPGRCKSTNRPANWEAHKVIFLAVSVGLLCPGYYHQLLADLLVTMP